MSNSNSGGVSSRAEIFNKVRDHLLKQGKRSLVNENGIPCAYKNKQGLKCAAGCLVPDDVLNAGFDGAAVHNHPWFQKNFPNNINFIGELQCIHDMVKVPAWEQSLREFAIKHELTY